MNYGRLKRESLRLIFSESIAGDEIESTYDNQADYIERIPGLYNAGSMEVATTYKKIPELVMLNDLMVEDLGPYKQYILPDDFFDMTPGGLTLMHQSEKDRFPMDHVRGYRLMGNKLLVPNRMENKGELMLEYWRFPHPLPENPKDTTELDNTPDVHEALPYYIAAHLVQYDDSFRYASLENEFEAKLQRLKNPTHVEESEVIDVYQGFNGVW